MRKISQRVAAAGLSAALIFGPAVAASADGDAGPPQHVLGKARESVGVGQERAVAMLAVAAARNPETGVPEHAQGDPDHATGLARAQEMVALAAAKLKGNETDKDNNGNAYGHGRAAEVHAALAGGLSPSSIKPYSEDAEKMLKVIERFTDEKPGRGLGRNKQGEDGDG